MKLNNICKKRKIVNSDIETPCIVPSFSGKGFANINNIHKLTKDYLTESKLVSAYDLYYKNIEYADLYSSEMLIIDSGGYETCLQYDKSDAYRVSYGQKEWNIRLYNEVLDKLRPYSKIVIVNFDKTAVGKSIHEQIENATEFFTDYPMFISDFLIKPSTSQRFINIDEFTDNIESFDQFDIIGISEKELGDSLKMRLENLKAIRDVMKITGLEIPIHIFGCIDPASMLLYFIFGADIFDGLSWLRYKFDTNYHSMYLDSSDYILNATRDDEEHYYNTIISNINILENVNDELNNFTKELAFESLSIDDKYRSHILQMISTIMEG